MVTGDMIASVRKLEVVEIRGLLDFLDGKAWYEPPVPVPKAAAEEEEEEEEEERSLGDVL